MPYASSTSTDKVPYTGAFQAVDLGLQSLSTTGDVLAGKFKIDCTINHEIYDDGSDNLVIQNLNQGENIRFLVKNAAGANIELLTLDGNPGNVGINNFNPQAVLHIVRTTTSSSFTLDIDTASGLTTADTLFTMSSETVEKARWFIDKSESENLRLSVGTTTQIATFAQDGNVGIGTSPNPSFKLDVQGTFRADGVASFGDDVGIDADNKKLSFGVDGVLNSYLQWTGSALEIVAVEQDMDLVFKIDDGGVVKSITWNADVDQLEHSAGLFNFADHIQISSGVLFLAETTTPTPIDSNGALYTKSNNELFFQDGVGAEHLLHGDSFSNMWFHSASVSTIAIGTTDEFNLITSFANVGEEDDLGNASANITTDEITIGANGSGKYNVTFHASITSSGGNSTMIVAIGIELATPLVISAATNATPIVCTSAGHTLMNGDMVTIAGATGNTAANGDWIVDSVAGDDFTLLDLDGVNSVGNGVYDAGTGSVDILYPGNLLMHRAVSQNDQGVGGVDADINILVSDKVALYVANVSGTNDLEVLAVSLAVFRIGD